MNAREVVMCAVIIVLYTLWQNRRREANWWRDH